MVDRSPMFALGLMSGTSCDGIDAALVKTNGESEIEFVDAQTFAYQPQLRERLLNVAQNKVAIDEMLLVERQLTLAHADACRAIQERTAKRPAIVGFHGHTIRHESGRSGSERSALLGMTQQIGDPNILAEKLACPVVSDFRRRDIATGGEGAPLVPLFHRELLRSVQKPTAVLNIGGVANITWLGQGDTIYAGDTGPGCGLVDAWVNVRTGRHFDDGGRLAIAGKIHREMLDTFLAQPYFQRRLPKSADRFEFTFEVVKSLSVEDGAATLCAATVAAVELTIEQLPHPPRTLYVAGGGARNPFLLGLLRDRLAVRWNCEVSSIDTLGLRSDSMEAECFAWLAVRRLRGLPTTLPETSGCRVPVCGGQLTF